MKILYYSMLALQVATVENVSKTTLSNEFSAFFNNLNLTLLNIQMKETC